MSDFGEEDWILPTLLSKDGGPSFRVECHTLQEAFVRVGKWPPADQARARFWYNAGYDAHDPVGIYV